MRSCRDEEDTLPPLPQPTTGKQLKTMPFHKTGSQVVVAILAVFGLAISASFFLNGVCTGGIGLSINSCWLTDNIGDTNGTASEPGDQLLQLPDVLKKAATPEKLVIITALNEAWAVPGSILDLFLESFRVGINTQQHLRHVLMVAVDPKAYDRCKVVHQHCYLLKTPGIDFSTEKIFMTKEYLSLLWHRIDFLGDIVELGYDFVFTDLDIMWLRDPLPALLSGKKDGVDITIACDHFYGNPDDLGNSANGGFYYVRSNCRTNIFFRYWYRSRDAVPEMDDQAMFNRIKGDILSNGLGLKFRFLDTTRFSGFCEVSKDPTKLITMHANCCIGLPAKLRDIRLLLDTWTNFTQSGAGSGFNWTFPAAKICG